MPSVQHVLTTLNAPLDEDQLWALALLTSAQLKSLGPSFPALDDPANITFLVNTHSTIINANGQIEFDTSSFGSEESVIPFLADEVKERDPYIDMEKAHVFSIGALLFTAADFSLLDDEEPSLSEDLEALITQMTDEAAEDRCSLDTAIELCTVHVCADDAKETLKDVVTLALSIEKAEGGIPRELLDELDATGAPVSPDSGFTQDATAFDETRDVHAALMREIQAKPSLKDVSARVLKGPEPYMTPHERLLRDIKRSSVASLNKTDTAEQQQQQTHQKQQQQQQQQQHGTQSERGGVRLSRDEQRGYHHSNSKNNAHTQGQQEHRHRRLHMGTSSASTSSSSLMSHSGTPARLSTAKSQEHLSGADSARASASSGKKRMPVRLALDSSALGSILGGLDASTQVKLAFAEQHAKGHSSARPQNGVRDNTTEKEEDTTQAQGAQAASQAGQKHDRGESGPHSSQHSDSNNDSKHQQQQQQQQRQQRQGDGPVKRGEGGPPLPASPRRREPEECSFVGFEEHRHISTTLFKAELDDLMYQDEQQYKAISARKLCPICRKTRFTLLTRGRECPMCTRFVCRSCRSDVTMPAHLRASSSTATATSAPASSSPSSSSPSSSGKTNASSGITSAGSSRNEGTFTVNLCNQCKNQLGGIRSKKR